VRYGLIAVELVDIDWLLYSVKDMAQEDKTGGVCRTRFRLLIDGFKNAVNSPPSPSLRAFFSSCSKGSSGLAPTASTGCQKK